MRQSRVRWSITAVAVLLNVLGSPMAWAQWLGAGAAEPVALAMEMASSPCHGHEAPSSPAPMPCCDGGCSCAAPAMFVYLAGTAVRIPHAAFLVPFDTSALPAHPFDDTLRPPIR